MINKIKSYEEWINSTIYLYSLEDLTEMDFLEQLGISTKYIDKVYNTLYNYELVNYTQLVYLPDNNGYSYILAIPKKYRFINFEPVFKEISKFEELRHYNFESVKNFIILPEGISDKDLDKYKFKFGLSIKPDNRGHIIINHNEKEYFSLLYDYINKHFKGIYSFNYFIKLFNDKIKEDDYLRAVITTNSDNIIITLDKVDEDIIN